MTTYLTLDQYVEQAGISYRTALRRLASNDVPGAEKVKSQWRIPLEALSTTQPDAELTTWEAPQNRADLERAEQLDLVDVVAIMAQLQGLLTVPQAEYLIGARLAKHPERLEALGGLKWGENGAWLVPQAGIKRLLGLL
jgi:hypothetical protein